MQDFKPQKILNTLHAAGSEAYYVGGCVRDTLLGREIHDWDITTSALPEEVMKCFPHCIPTGVKHGTVTVCTEECQAEVTTYRTDGRYADGRHPEQVCFVRSLKEDLARRDFTVNAMAMDVSGALIDLFGGETDLHAGVLRCVGEPERRFREDALRMLRAVRFSAQLGFTIEQGTWEAIGRCAGMCEQLSVERIRDEIEKTLMSPHPERIADMVSFGMLKRFGTELTGDAAWLASLPARRPVRWAGLCRIWPGVDLQVLRLDKRTACNAMEAASFPVPEDRLGWKRLVAEHGSEKVEITAALEGQDWAFAELLLSGECMSLRELAVNGADFPERKGKELGNHLHKLLYHVLKHPGENQREILLNL